MEGSRKPRFRADHVGSLLRPQPLIDAREKHARGEIDVAGLREVEDAAIEDVVRKQEEIGLQGITDGEFRRTFFHVDFLEQLDGVTVAAGGFTATFRDADHARHGAIRHRRAIQGRDYDFLANVSRRTPKVCIPSLSMPLPGRPPGAISEKIYPDLDRFYANLSAAHREEVRDLAARGCRYLQMDDTSLAHLRDDRIRESTRARGDDPAELPHLYCRLINEAIAGRPDDMAICIHLCRGNYQSARVGTGTSRSPRSRSTSS